MSGSPALWIGLYGVAAYGVGFFAGRFSGRKQMLDVVQELKNRQLDQVSKNLDDVQKVIDDVLVKLKRR